MANNPDYDFAARRKLCKSAFLLSITVVCACGDSESGRSSASHSTNTSLAASSQSGPNKAALLASASIAAGQNVILDASQFDLQQVTAAASEVDLDQYIEAGKVNDLLGVAEMKEEGRIFFLPNGTHALVLEYVPPKARIRIFGPPKPSKTFKYYGRTAWVLSPTLKAK